MDVHFFSVYKNAKKNLKNKNYPAFVSSRLINKPTLHVKFTYKENYI